VDVQAIVIGAGHAGIEASLALARLGLQTLLVTQSLDCIGRMSCNPAIGGIAKGNLVREIDALGGEMGKLIDATMIQFRVLNRSRGPAVQAPRAQADKQAYAALAARTLQAQGSLHLLQDTVVDLILDSAGARVQGVVTERGARIGCRAVVLTTGTFMEGKLFIGDWSASGGRLGEPAAVGLGASLRRMGFAVGRLKTGTPARGLRGSLVLERMELQQPDREAEPFSFANDTVDRPAVPCHITYTTAETHRIIRENIHRSPLYTGRIVGRGPRYCPSIEDKVVRFPDRPRHQVFVEPEGLGTEEVYLNGISSSLPEEVQERFIHTIPGLESLEIVRPGYAVEYDYLPPTQLLPSLMTKRVEGLFAAGQTNGTSGYEEAAAQGLMAGINAALFLMGREPFVLSRADAYIGVLIDDLVTLGTEEPYRLFTSRAEYRLSLRADTADARLMPKARVFGLQGEEALARLERKARGIGEIRTALRARTVSAADEEVVAGLEGYRGRSLEQVLRDPRFTLGELARLLGADGAAGPIARARPEWLGQAEAEVKYEGYIRRQDEQVARFRKMEEKRIPASFDYQGIVGLSSEAREKLAKIRPASIGQASRISGVRPADIAVLLLYVRRGTGAGRDAEGERDAGAERGGG
jgi:tRNA uridine 5-carboxymethylaminomethyl modification enzyme